MVPSDGPSVSMSSSNADKGPAILASTLSVVSVATLFVTARLYARGRILKRFFLDDYFVILALICAWTAVALQTVSVENGFGQHIWTLTPSQRTLALKYNTISYVPSILSVGIPKLGVVALLTRVFANTASTFHRTFLWFMVICCNILLALTAIFVLVQCRPLSILWDPSVKGTCWNVEVQIRFSISASVISAVVDLYLAIYPTIVLAKLRINKIKKFMLSFALGFGFISAIVAAYKTSLIPNLSSPDMTYAVVGLSIWTIVEGSTVTIATTIPVLQPLVYKLFGDDALGSRKRDAQVFCDQHHQQLRDSSADAHIEPCRHNSPAVDMDSTPVNTNASTSTTVRAQNEESTPSYSTSEKSDTALQVQSPSPQADHHRW